MSHSTVSKIRSFEGQWEQIKADRELSELGKLNAKKKLDAQIAEYRDTSLTYLRGDWSIIRRRFQEWETKRQEAQERAASSWDYQRLNYEKTAIEAQFKATGHDLQAIESLYSRMADSGDRHKAKVAAEIGGALVSDIFGATDLQARDLVRRMSKDLEELNTTEELKQVEKEGEGLASQAVELYEATKEVASYYGPRNGFGNDREFTALLEGVSIKQTAQPADPAHFLKTQVSID